MKSAIHALESDACIRCTEAVKRNMTASVLGWDAVLCYCPCHLPVEERPEGWREPVAVEPREQMEMF